MREQLKSTLCFYYRFKVFLVSIFIFYTWIFLQVTPGHCTSTPTHSPLPMQVHFDRIEGHSIFFSTFPTGGQLKPFKTDLWDLKYIGVLHSQAGGFPYFLFSAKPCKDCEEDKAIYIVRPEGNKPLAFVYPGDIMDPHTGSFTLKSRAFFGECLNGYNDSLVIFQQEKVDKKRHKVRASVTQTSVYIAEAAKEHLVEKLIERRPPSLQSILSRVKRKKICFEIEGRNRKMAPKLINLHIQDDDDDEDTEDGTELESNSE